MKVIKPGRQQTGWSKKYTCTGKGNGGGGCKAKLLVCEPDLYITFTSCFRESPDRHVTFTCIACGVETDIEEYPHPHKLPNKSVWLARQQNPQNRRLS
mgnify:CR=1 FL=1